MQSWSAHGGSRRPNDHRQHISQTCFLHSAASEISADENSTDRWRHPHAADKINRNIRPSRNDNQLVLIIQCGHVHTSPNSKRLHADRASSMPDRPTDCPPSLPRRRSTGRPGALHGRPVAHRPGYHQHHRLRRTCTSTDLCTDKPISLSFTYRSFEPSENYLI